MQPVSALPASGQAYLDTVRDADDFRSAQEPHDEPSRRNIGLTTVYRTLQSMASGHTAHRHR